MMKSNALWPTQPNFVVGPQGPCCSTTCLHPAVSCTVTFIFLQLYLYPAINISFSRSLFRAFLGRAFSLWLCAVHSASVWLCCHRFFLTLCDSRFHSLLLSWPNPGLLQIVVPKCTHRRYSSSICRFHCLLGDFFVRNQTGVM